MGALAGADSVKFPTVRPHHGFNHRHMGPGWPGDRLHFGFRPHLGHRGPYWSGGYVGRIYWRPAYAPPPYMRHNYGYPPMDQVRPAGRLVVKVHPEHAAVFVDGYPLARTGQDLYEIGLLAGEHRIEVRAQGHHNHNQDIVIRKGQQQFADVKLRPQE